MPRNIPRPEPSAPPIHMMPDQQHQGSSASNEDSRERSPPPRYEEAIADPVVQSDRLFPPTGMQQRAAYNNRISSTHIQQPRRRSSDNVANSSPTETRNGRLNSQESRFRRRHNRSADARYGSASSDDLSDGRSDAEENNETTPAAVGGGTTTRRGRQSGEQVKKRSSGSKIKRGLENIAFFIIQILD